MSGLAGPFATEPRDTRWPETPVYDLANALQIIEYERVHPDTASDRRLLQVLADLERRITIARSKLIEEADA